MFFALLLTLIATAGGACLTYLYDEGASLLARVCAGVAIGLTLLGLFGFAIASFIGLTPVALALSALVVASPLLLLLKPRWRAVVRDDIEEARGDFHEALNRPGSQTLVHVAFYAGVAVALWFVFERAMIEDANGISTGVLNNFGDLPFHLSVITSFAKGQNFAPEDPTFAGARFTYPFISDFIAAIFFKAGASLRDGMFLENFVLAMALVGLLHRWALELTRERLVGLLTPLIVLLSGGFGWWLVFKDAKEGERGILATLLQPPHSYTIIPDSQWRWGNALTTLFVPQRSLLLGLPLALIIFTQWWIAIRGEEGKEIRGEKEEGKGKKAKGKSGKKKGKQAASSSSSFPTSSFPNEAEANSPASSFPFNLFPSYAVAKRLIAAGVVAGLLPLSHAHTFIVVMGVGAGIFLLLGWKEWRAWAAFFIVALLIAGPQMLWATHGSSVSTQSFTGFKFGWDNEKDNFVWFWLKNTGVFIPMLLLAITWRGENYLVPRKLLLYYLPFVFCFIVPNLFKMAPWIWDNIKVLYYWWVASAPLVALALARMWQRGSWLRAASAVLFVLLTLAGAIDVWGLASGSNEFGEFDKNGVAFAAVIEQNTQPRSMIIHAPIHNAPVFLTGRRSLMGYPGHIWTHGLSFSEREAEIKRIYAGTPDAESLLKKYGVEYVVVSPLEHSALHNVNERFFERFQKVGEVGDYRLYKVARQ